MLVRNIEGAGQNACGGPVACTPISYYAAVTALSKTDVKDLEKVDWKKVTQVGVQLYRNVFPQGAEASWYATYANVNDWMRKNNQVLDYVGRREYTIPRYCKLTNAGLAHVKRLVRLVPDLFADGRVLQIGRMHAGLADFSLEFVNWKIDAEEKLKKVDPHVFDGDHYSNLNLFASQIISIDAFAASIRKIEIVDTIEKKKSDPRDPIISGTLTTQGRTTSFWSNGEDFAYMDSHGSAFRLYELKNKDFDKFMREQFCEENEPVFMKELTPAESVDFVRNDVFNNNEVQITLAVFKMVEKYN